MSRHVPVSSKTPTQCAALGFVVLVLAGFAAFWCWLCAGNGLPWTRDALLTGTMLVLLACVHWMGRMLDS